MFEADEGEAVCGSGGGCADMGRFGGGSSEGRVIGPSNRFPFVSLEYVSFLCPETGGKDLNLPRFIDVKESSNFLLFDHRYFCANTHLINNYVL